MEQGKSRRKEAGEFSFRAGPVHYRKQWAEDYFGPRLPSGRARAALGFVAGVIRVLVSWFNRRPPGLP